MARRVAEELQVPMGGAVGYQIRFEERTTARTYVKFMTDGILLAEIQSDPSLRSYSTLILDEAHERSLNIDFLLGYLQGLLKRRGDLKLIVTSATIDTEAFSKAFGGAPVIQVSGRSFPVEIRYAALEDMAWGDSEGATMEEGGYIEAAVRMTEEVLIESDTGDVLVFLPTERDIREARDAMEGSLGSGIDVLGLFGHMPAAEQQRIFAPGGRRRVVVATNIAETSLTIPRIGYVIDAGMSRVSRYNPRTRTKRLPIEPISQSSANQRAGRAGRISAGVCIRLYSQEDFDKRPPFSQPEIQRANLAEVILRMKAFRLGEIETFPFLNPPQASAIRAGYVLLHELGALTETNELTSLGRELAKLPVDPTLGRMLLQARQEKAVPELLIIAAGLSVPDPRERPDDAKEAAATAHRAFADKESDFIALLKIWRQAPPPDGSHNTLRRFCKTNYLSITRMREWREIYRQLAEMIRDDGGPTGGRGKGEGATYDAIHRSILAGLLGQIALKQERNGYKAGGNRLVTVFPGSHLHERREKNEKPQPGKKPDAGKQPQWIVAGEIVETSKLFARMLARIDPQWAVELGRHLCEFRYQEPFWCVKSGRVLASERVLIHGLEITRRKVDYGRIEPAEATEIFIRCALVAQDAAIPQHFYAENKRVREKIETALTRVRSSRVLDLDEAFYRFYAKRVTNVSSIHDLNKLVAERRAQEPQFLFATEEELMGETELAYDKSLFPDQVSMGNSVLPVTYAYAPGGDNDGVTVHVPLPVIERLSAAEVQWMAPGLREEQIGVLLRALPKSVRRTLLPIEPKVREVAQCFMPGKEDFLESLAAFLSRKYQVTVRAQDWPPQSLPDHLRPRVQVIDRQQRTVAAGRDLAAVRGTLESMDLRSDAWERAAKRWERQALSAWSFGDLPETVTIENVSGTPLLGYLGLALEEGQPAVRLYRKQSEARETTPPAVRKLAELALAKDLAWLHKELRALAARWLTKAQPGARGSGGNPFGALAAAPRAGAPGFDSETLAATGCEHLACALLRLDPILPLTEARFRNLVESVRKDLPAAARRMSDLAAEALASRGELLATSKRYAALESDLQRLVPPDFLAKTPPAQLAHLPRYLRAVKIRAERAALNPGKDAEKARQLAPFANWQKCVPPEECETFRWLLEEYRVSIFAQELGTSGPVSEKRLKALGAF